MRRLLLTAAALSAAFPAAADMHQASDPLARVILKQMTLAPEKATQTALLVSGLKEGVLYEPVAAPEQGAKPAAAKAEKPAKAESRNARRARQQLELAAKTGAKI